MRYICIDKGTPTVIAVAESNYEDAKRQLQGAGYTIKEVVLPPPSEAMLEEYKLSGVAYALDGCRVNGLCSCKHGCRSYLAVTIKRA